MAKPLIKVTLNPPLKELQRRQQESLKKLQNNRSAMAKVATLLDRWVLVNFRTSGGKVGGWDALAAGGRPIKGGGFDSSAQILQDTGRLRASFKPFFSKNNAGIGSDLPYSKAHEEGLGNLPQRRMLPKKQEVIKEALKIVERHVKDSFK